MDLLAVCAAGVEQEASPRPAAAIQWKKGIFMRRVWPPLSTIFRRKIGAKMSSSPARTLNVAGSYERNHGT